MRLQNKQLSYYIY